MKKLMTVLALTLTVMVANAQMSESKLNTNDPNEMITRGPEFPGGVEALTNLFGDNYAYPAKATRMGKEGTVILEFYIGTDGSISEEIEVLQSVGAGLDEEAIRLAKNMPLWLPALQNGVAVKVKYQLPIHFELR